MSCPGLSAPLIPPNTALPVDNLGYCPADIALSLNNTKIYTLLQSHGVRSEFLLSLLASKGLDNKDDENHITLKDGEEDTMAGNTDKFLESKLTYVKDDEGNERVVDDDGNGVSPAISIRYQRRWR